MHPYESYTGKANSCNFLYASNCSMDVMDSKQLSKEDEVSSDHEKEGEHVSFDEQEVEQSNPDVSFESLVSIFRLCFSLCSLLYPDLK